MSGILFSLSLIGSVQTALDRPIFPGKVAMWLLFMLSIVSWVMILSKALQLRKVRQSDRRFGKRLRASQTTLEVFEEGWENGDSSHYLVYLAGARETAFQLLGSREPREGMGLMVREAGLLAENQGRSLRSAFRAGLREAQIQMEQGIAGFRLIAVAAGLLGMIGFVWTLMIGLDNATETTEVMPIIGSSLGFLSVALMVTAPALLALSVFSIVLRGRKHELRRFHDDLVRLFERKFCKWPGGIPNHLPDEEGDGGDDDPSGRGGKQRYHSIRERLLSGPSEPLNLDEIQINPIARQAGAQAQ